MNQIKSFLLSYLLIISSEISVAQLTPVSISIPMRDGKFLAADVYLPNNDSIQRPTILIQTPYNKNFYPFLGLPLQIGSNVNASPFNFVIADWRCFYGSTAACIATPKRGEDGFDCVEWIAQQIWSDGQIGTWGPSALGIIQFQTAKEKPPHLVCSVPIVSGMRTGYIKYYPGGVYRTEYVQMLDNLGYGLSTILLAHPVKDIYWTISENNTFYPDSIEVPMFMIGGWYDHATEDVLETFNGIQMQSSPSVRSKHKLLIGPWTHNTTSSAPLNVGQLDYPQAVNVSDSLARVFFEYQLLNVQNGWASRPTVEYFQMGENTWKSDSSWNNAGVNNVDLYFQSQGDLDLNMPTSSSAFLNFNYDPKDPSPTIGGPTLLSSLNQGPDDQASQVENRNDILSFTTIPLAQDIVLKGRPVAHLKVSSDKTDTDFSIRLTDVYPDGRSMLVLDGIRRMRFRNGYQAGDTSNILPGSVYSLDIDLFANTAITFLAGHRIRVDVTSSNYPRFDCNLNNGQQMYVAGDTMTASNKVYVDNVNASYITLPLVGFPNSIEVNKTADEFYVFPNPADNFIRINYFFPVREGATVKIFDLVGKEILKQDLTNKKELIDVHKLVPGIYFLKMEYENKVLTRRFIIER